VASLNVEGNFPGSEGGSQVSESAVDDCFSLTVPELKTDGLSDC
jgi:hypothetical protein